jgi:hypothetical protein
MPTTIDAPLEGYAHCLNPRCPGYAQEPVKALRRETSYTYVELNGTAEGSVPGFERSQVSVRVRRRGRRRVPVLRRRPRDHPQPRTQYQNLSGHDPNGLLNLRPGEAPDVGALQAEIAALKQKVGDAA